MKPEAAQLARLLDFRSASCLYVGVAGLILLTPFSINNFFQGRELLGLGTLVIIVLLSVNAWYTRDGEYHPSLTFFGVVPAGILLLHYTITQQGLIGLLWCYPSALAFYLMLPERQAWLANAMLLLVNLPLAWTVVENDVAIRVSATLLAMSLFAAIFVRVISCQQQRLHTQLVTDPLTGLSNRLLLNATLERAAEQMQRAGIPMTLLTVDMDHFKAINDTLGHDSGDEVLRGVGELIRQRSRGSDSAFRLGGEEFLLLLFNTSTENGLHFAETLRADIEALPLLSDRAVTASIGVASLGEGEAWKAWMKRSDDNLYSAKATGRNCVVG